MRTRTRDMVRMLATLRHSAQCRTLRAAKAHEALLRAKAEAQDDGAEVNDDDDAKTPAAPAPLQRRH